MSSTSDTARLDAVADGRVVIQAGRGQWTARHTSADGWRHESYHVRPTLREAIDAALNLEQGSVK